MHTAHCAQSQKHDVVIEKSLVRCGKIYLNHDTSVVLVFCSRPGAPLSPIPLAPPDSIWNDVPFRDLSPETPALNCRILPTEQRINYNYKTLTDMLYAGKIEGNQKEQRHYVICCSICVITASRITVEY